MFIEKLDMEIKRAKRRENGLSLFFIDLDSFKEVNDNLGHMKGDELLVQVAQRLSSSVRESDIVGRLGGDEFCIMFPTQIEPTQIKRMAENIIKEISRVFILSGDVVYISASIGITLYPQDSLVLKGLLHNADLAMYNSKNSGGNQYTFYNQIL